MKGNATHLGDGIYSIRLSSGRKEKVEVDVLRPDMEELAAGPKTCSGPLVQGCCGGIPVELDGRAEVLEAIRSLFCLELPFFLWRFYFEFGKFTLTGSNIILLLKNFVFGLHDLLVLFSCNNTGMTCLGTQVLESLNTLTKGSAVSSVFVGPAGFARVAADLGTNMQKGKLEQRKAALQTQKAWMLVDRETTREPSGHLSDAHPGTARFNAAIKKTESRIARIEKELATIHT